jgi:hypothetical protein
VFVKLVMGLVLAAAVWSGTVRTSGAGGTERVYVVRPADTLWTIAEREYAGDPREAVWRVSERNGLASSLLRPGQRLVLPPSE